MFTSRAEHRLLLRHDNAADRLAESGHRLGLISSEQLAAVEDTRERITQCAVLLQEAQIRVGQKTGRRLQALGTVPLQEQQSAAQLLRRPQVGFADVLEMMAPEDRDKLSSAPPEVVEQLEIQARYDGYIRRQTAEIRRHRATESLALPPDFKYDGLEGLTFEARDKLGRIRPSTVGQASRIPGVSPADISILLVHVRRAQAGGDATAGGDTRAGGEDLAVGTRGA